MSSTAVNNDTLAMSARQGPQRQMQEAQIHINGPPPHATGSLPAIRLVNNLTEPQAPASKERHKRLVEWFECLHLQGSPHPLRNTSHVICLIFPPERNPPDNTKQTSLVPFTTLQSDCELSFQLPLKIQNLNTSRRRKSIIPTKPNCNVQLPNQTPVRRRSERPCPALNHLLFQDHTDGR